MCDLLYVSHVCVCLFVFFFFLGGGGGGCRGKNKNRSGRIVVAGGEAGREGMCNVYKTIDGGVKSI